MDTALIKQAAIFADLDQDEIERIAEICSEQRFRSAQTVFKEGDPGNRLFIIAEGEVRVSRQVPGSGEEAKNRFDNVEYLTAHDQVKFVICDRADYDWSKRVTLEQRLTERCEVLFSPSAQQLPAGELADWIVADRLPVRFQIQLHKYLWGDEAGR